MSSRTRGSKAEFGGRSDTTTQLTALTRPQCIIRTSAKDGRRPTQPCRLLRTRLRLIRRNQRLPQHLQSDSIQRP